MPIIMYAILDTTVMNEPISHFIEKLSFDSSIQFELLCFHELTAVVSIKTAEKSAKSREELLRYAGIIDKLAQKYSVLPMRYGSVVSSYEDVTALLEKNSDSILQVLKRIINKEEYSLRILFSHQHQDSEFNEGSVDVNQLLPGILLGNSENKRYLLKKYQKHIIEEMRSKYIEKIQSLVIRDLRKITELIEFNKKASPAFLIDAVILIDKSAKCELLAFVASLQSMYPEHNVILTGPWPAYNFAKIKLE
jgi:hypothetical protein